MKFRLVSLMLLIFSVLHCSTWQTFSNTDHTYDLVKKGKDLYLSSWGGVVELKSTNQNPQNLNDYYEATTINTGSGLVSNDIRSMAYIDFSQSLWLGSSDEGITIINSSGMQQVGVSLGLPSAKVSRIIEHQSTILVASSAGLTSFYYLEGVNFPLMLHQYTYENTSGGLAGNNIDDMMLAPDGNLYVSTSAGFSYIALDSLEVDSAWHRLSGIGSPVPIGMGGKITANSNFLAVSVMNSVYLQNLETGVWRVFNSLNGLSGERVSSLLLDSEDNLWISYGTWSESILNFSNSHETLMTTIYSDGSVFNWQKNLAGLEHSTISRIVQLDNSIYLCSWGNGIYQKSGDEWLNFSPSTIGFPKIAQIATDKNNAIWFASGYISDQPVRKGSMGTCMLDNGSWQTYNINNSPIHTDNILTVAVDNLNRKWFGTWDNSSSPTGWERGLSIFDNGDPNIWRHMTRDGLRIWNNETLAWGDFDGATKYKLTTATVAGIYPAEGDLMMVMCYDGGVDVINPDMEIVERFRLPNSANQQMLYGYYNGSQYFFGTNNDNGLVIWNHNSIPVTGGDHWVIPPPQDLNNCIVYGVVSLDTPYEGRQHWIAASTGLFMWNETDWYRYDTMIKRFKYNNSSIPWVNDTLYYENEERLFGSVRTTPTSILLDPFNRIWIGSLENGLTMYNPETERFTNYFKPNFPLLSNYITTLGYDPVRGNLMIGTPDGLNTLKIGRTVKPDTKLNKMKAFPNPFRPAIHQSVQIVNMPDDSLPAGTSTCKIFDSSGAIVAVIKENAFSRFEWNGRSTSGKECSSGIYFYSIGDEAGNVKQGKLALIR
ncbi:MAG: hypothetical protein PHO32_02820 [Candidatus Cloacimonetes bacterium]|nr:hypothetical protein [Candidatus Cloacimonadota bacterium]